MCPRIGCWEMYDCWPSVLQLQLPHFKMADQHANGDSSGKLTKFPIARIKTIMRSSPDLSNVSQESVFMITKATVSLDRWKGGVELVRDGAKFRIRCKIWKAVVLGRILGIFEVIVFRKFELELCLLGYLFCFASL